MRSLGGWVLDQVFELVGIIAEVRRRHLLKTRTDEAHRKALEAAPRPSTTSTSSHSKR